MDKDLQSIQETRELLRQAKQAQRALAGMSQEQLDKITAAIAAAAGEHARRLADMAVEETGFGKKEDKELKNRFAATTLYEAIRDEKTHGILAENREKRTIDIGVPVGIVAGLVPSTNPTSTVIYKSMICMKAGNPIIFSPHPSAVNCILVRDFFETSKFLIMVSKSPIPYQSGHDKAKDIFKGAFLWNMPEDDIEQYVKPVWETMHTLLVAHTPLNYGIRGKNLIPGSSFNSVFHLRPHASKGKDNGSAKDRSILPNGEVITKQCFWLDRRYIARIIASNL